MSSEDAARARSAGDERGVPDDPLVRETEQVEEASRAARTFDVRRIIGGLFVLYGLIVGIYGLVDGAAAERKAQGIDINLWSGLGMLALGLLFVVWERTRPIQLDEDEARQR